MRAASGVFFGFAIYLVVTTGAILSLSPDAGKPGFVLQVFLIMGALLTLAIYAAIRFRQGHGFIPGTLIAGYLTQVVIVGWLKDRTLHLDAPGHPVLMFLRTFGGIYIFVLWAGIVSAAMDKARRKTL
ncbi:MAG: hypothetical protein KatS3mg110_4675 [Pirellulaceae bacterium]|nr:MAG: hypothetical protein KatS3mg110_4675 [Pirellulaceae bacterium]